jgi:hypothetical protein
VLHEAISVQEVIDRECAHEFLKEATRLAASEELVRIGAALAAKSELFREHLSAEGIGALSEEDWSTLAARMFFFRRKRAWRPGSEGFAALRASIADLLHGAAPVRERFNTFVAARTELKPALRFGLASELLFYSQPERYWLWTHWIWDPATRGGALRLVLQDDAELAGADAGETYEQVGKALASLQRVGAEDGFAYLGRGPFGVTVFLACVYAVYMYTVFQMRISKEFNRVLPELPEFAQRLLGVHDSRQGQAHV